ncbi:MAG: endonuclease/exonuclease/phosphatase, partial [Candidatus Tectomicrobia bacterium]|nr:endonuclease/exonuclease/phosphatase [Candidatus Tectomicrobia bacterium]
MPFYASLTRESVQVQQRAAAGLLALQAQLKASVPARTMAETLLLATWNIREFDSAKYGPRCAESFFYIAEIIDHFDLVAIQEVREDLTALHQLLDILGAWWRYIVTDVTAGAAGNGERLAFVYDSRKVTFNGLAGE